MEPVLIGAIYNWEIEMEQSSPVQIITFFLLSLVAVIFLSRYSTQLWGGKPETSLEVKQDMVVDMQMSVGQFGVENQLPKPVLKKVFGLSSRQDLKKTLSSFAMSEQTLRTKIDQAIVIEAEHTSKNWVKIPLKFSLWFFFLAGVFVLIRKGDVSPSLRRILYLVAIFVFGIVLGSDPSPMGTVKDAIALYGAKGVIFKPRMVALTIFLSLVLLANKFICGWGCQLGTLQDFILRLNRNAKDSGSVLPQFKPTFLISNSIRTAFFAMFTFSAFYWTVDIVDPIDPFKVFKPAMIGSLGWIFIVGICITSLFVYRPWCQFFCPFGLVGWLVEKISLFKVTVDYDTCTACKACETVCPSTAMEAILRREKSIPDCFSCGTCINICPTKSIGFKAVRRRKPPTGKF